MGHLETPDLIVIGCYAAGMILVGWWYARRQKTLEEYFVAGRGVGSFIVGISMIATLLSTISYITVPGELIKNGFGLMWGVLSFPVIFIVIGYLIIPRIMKHKITSGYELLEERFGPGMRQVAAGLFMLLRIMWMSFVILTCSRAILPIIDCPEEYLGLIMLVVGVFAVAYTVLGGIRAVMITDVVQFIILMGGAILTVVFVTKRCGGFSWIPDFSSPAIADLGWREVKFFSISPFERQTVVTMALYMGLTWIMEATSDQVLIQRYLCTRDARQARRSFLYCLVGDLAIVLALCAVGIALIGFFMAFPGEMPDTSQSMIEQADKLFPHYIATLLPPGITGLVTAALFAAAMSSMDSGINSITTVLLTDFKKVFAGGCGDDNRRLMKRARIIGLMIGGVVIAVSNVVQYTHGQNLFDQSMRISGYFVVPLFVIFVMAFFVRFSTPAGGYAAVAVGFLAGVLFSFWQPLLGYFGIEYPEFSPFLITMAAALVSICAGILVSALTKPRTPART